MQLLEAGLSCGHWAARPELVREVTEIVMGCYDRTRQVLEEQADTLTRVAEALLEHEVLDAEQIAALVKGEPLPMRPETRTDSREQLEAARKETGDRKKQATRAGEGLPMLPQPGRQPSHSFNREHFRLSQRVRRVTC